MRGLNLKKIAAVGAGLALIVSSVSAVPAMKSDILDSTAKTMKVNGIVVGASAAASDSTAAESLASSIAKLAVTTSTMPNPAYVAPSAAKDVNLNDSMAKSKREALGSFNGGSGFLYGKSQGLNTFLDETKSVEVNDDSSSPSLREYIRVTGSSSYDTSKDVQSLVAEVGRGNLEYVVKVAGGATTGGLYLGTGTYDSNSTNYVTLPFLGQWYELDNASPSSKKLELVLESDKDNWMNVGDVIPGLKGRDGTTYKLVVADGVSSISSNKVILELYSETDNSKVATETVAAGDTARFRKNGKDLLMDSVKVKDVTVKTVSNTDTYRVNLRTGLNRVVLEDGKCYPNFDDSASKDKCDWQAFVTFSSNKLQEYGLSNVRSYTDKEALVPGKSFSIANYGGFKFVGFDDEEMTVAKVGAAISNASSDASETGFVFSDDQDTLRQLPFYLKDSVDVDGSATDDKDAYNLTLDGKDFAVYFDKNSDGVFFGSEEGEYNLDRASDIATTPLGFTLSGMSNDDIRISPTALTFALENGLNASYRVVVKKNSTSSYDVWLVLASQSFSMKDGLTAFRGTMFPSGNDTEYDYNLDVRAPMNNTVELGYYLPRDLVNDGNSLDLNSSLTTTVTDDDKRFFTAVFDTTVDGNAAVTATNYVARTYIDTETGKLTDEDDSDNSLTYAVAYGQVADSNLGLTTSVASGNVLKLKSGERKSFISSYGSIVEIKDDEYAQITVPQNQIKVEYLFYDKTAIVGGTTTTDSNVPATLTTTTPYMGAPLTVTTDGQADMSKHYIVVGGYAVNNLFAKETSLTEKLSKEGDKVAETLNGNVYVAGFTAEDTTAAVDDLVRLLSQ